jgi:ribosomal protein L11 methyltransferase
VRWLELTVEADVEAVEAVSEIFARVGASAAVRPTRLLRDQNDELAAREDPAAPYEVTVHLPDDGAAPAALEATEKALWHLQAFGLRPVGELRVRSVDETDWTEAWKAGYATQRVGRVLIVPSWMDEDLKAGEVALRLDPGMAFGTGLHPTTRACLGFLQSIGPMPLQVLDVGSGSGILALAALRLGAERARCLDTDPAAVEATLANAARNGLADRVVAEHGSLPAMPDGEVRYPLVVANLVAAVLIELAASLAAHVVPGGMLIAGGIIDTRAQEVEAAMVVAGFRVERLDEAEDWITFLLRREP